MTASRHAQGLSRPGRRRAQGSTAACRQCSTSTAWRTGAAHDISLSTITKIGPEPTNPVKPHLTPDEQAMVPCTPYKPPVSLGITYVAVYTCVSEENRAI